MTNTSVQRGRNSFESNHAPRWMSLCFVGMLSAGCAVEASSPGGDDALPTFDALTSEWKDVTEVVQAHGLDALSPHERERLEELRGLFAMMLPEELDALRYAEIDGATESEATQHALRTLELLAVRQGLARSSAAEPGRATEALERKGGPNQIVGWGWVIPAIEFTCTIVGAIIMCRDEARGDWDEGAFRRACQDGGGGHHTPDTQNQCNCSNGDVCYYVDGVVKCVHNPGPEGTEYRVPAGGAICPRYSL